MSVVTRLRAYKIADMPIFDLFGTIVLALLVGYFVLQLRNGLDFTLWVAIVFMVGIVTHIVFGVNTMLGYYLGLCGKPSRVDIKNSK